MTQFSVEISGSLSISASDYLEELFGQDDLSEPRLVALRRRFGPNSIEDMDRRQADAIVETELYELLTSYETKIAREITERLEDRPRRRRGPEFYRYDDEPKFHVAIRFGRGSLLYTAIVTILESTGPTIAKAGLASLVVAAVEPILIERVRSVCGATRSITSYVRDAIVRSPTEPVLGAPATLLDDKVGALGQRVEKLAAQLEETRPYRRSRALVMLVIGILMANTVTLIAIARKVGLF